MRYLEKQLSFLNRTPVCSPIIQNGKLVGAITHVLINDPTTGYGIFIENVIIAAEMPKGNIIPYRSDIAFFILW